VCDWVFRTAHHLSECLPPHPTHTHTHTHPHTCKALRSSLSRLACMRLRRMASMTEAATAHPVTVPCQLAASAELADAAAAGGLRCSEASGAGRPGWEGAATCHATHRHMDACEHAGMRECKCRGSARGRQGMACVRAMTYFVAWRSSREACLWKILSLQARPLLFQPPPSPPLQITHSCPSCETLMQTQSASLPLASFHPTCFSSASGASSAAAELDVSATTASGVLSPLRGSIC
jgi:hypothetical protein